MSDSSKQTLKYEDLFDHIGHAGKGQIIWYIYLGYYGIIGGYNTISIVFSQYEGEYKCADVGWKTNTSECEFNGDSCQNFTYDNERFKTTLVSDFDLVCKNEYQLLLAGFAYYLPQLFTGPLAGWVSDNYGRKKAMIAGQLAVIGASIGMYFCKNIWLYIFLKVTLGGASTFGFNVAFTLATEIIGPKYEFYTSLNFQGFWALGYILLSPVSFWVRTWNGIEAFLSIISAPALIALFFMDESPRWLLSTGKFEEARQVIVKLVKMNNKEQKTIKSLDLENIHGLDEEKETLSFLALFKNGRDMTLISLMVIYVWFAISLGFYGLGLGAAQIPGTVFFTNAINGFCDAISYMLFSLVIYYSKITHKISLVLCLGLSGCSLLLYTLFGQLSGNSDDFSEALVVAALCTELIGKFFNCCAFALIYVYVSDIYPTNLKTTIVGFCCGIECIAALVSVAFNPVYELVPWCPGLVYGSCSIFASLLMTRLPDSDGAGALMGIDDAKRFYKEQRNKPF